MPYLKRATAQLHRLGGEALEYYVSSGLWGYAIMPEGHFFKRVTSKIYNSTQEAIEAFANGERPVVEPLEKEE